MRRNNERQRPDSPRTEDRRRRRRATRLAVGGTVASLSVGSALAVVIDSIDLTDNVGRSGEFAPAGGDVQMAVADLQEGCSASGLFYEDGPFEGVFVQDFDLAPGWNSTLPWDGEAAQPRAGGEALGEPVALCIRNAGSLSTSVQHSSSVTFSIEDGECTAVEVSAGDSSCADGDAGEIDDLGFVAIVSHNAECVGVGDAYPTGGRGQEWGAEEVVVLYETIAPGADCPLIIMPFIQAADDEAYLRLQTDLIGWTTQLFVEA